MTLDFDQLQTRVQKLSSSFTEYEVTLDSDGIIVVGDYQIDPEQMQCSCRDNTFRGHETPCKHILAWWLTSYLERREESLEDIGL